VWTEAHRRGAALEAILPRFTTGPASIVRLADRGRIAEGVPAHLAVFDPGAAYVLDAADLAYRNRMSPWQGRALRGIVRETYLHGELVHTSEGGLRTRRGREVLADAAALAGAPS
jgi:allantoinase